MKLKGKRTKSNEEKELAKSRTKVLSKVRQTLARLRNELFPDSADMSEILGEEEVTFKSPFVLIPFEKLFILILETFFLLFLNLFHEMKDLLK